MAGISTYGLNSSIILDSANLYLSVINDPNNSGLLCNFVPYQTWLGGKKSIIGLPNIPNHSLGRMDGSVCDSLTGIHENITHDFHFETFPNPKANDDLSISYRLPKNKSGNFAVYSVEGKKVFEMNLPQWSVRQMVRIPSLESGVYCGVITSGEYKAVKRIIIMK